MIVNNVFSKYVLILYLSIVPNILLSKSFVFFSPNDNVSSKLIECIKSTKHKIHAAVYMLTDKRVANALIAAHDRGVDVQLVTDSSCLENEFGKVDLLKENGVEVFVFKSHSNKDKYSNQLMHNKFALLDNKLWTGSYNWTVSADKKNHENVIYTDDIDIYKRYEKQFQLLKEKSVSRILARNKKRVKKRVYSESSNKKNEKELRSKIIKALKYLPGFKAVFVGRGSTDYIEELKSLARSLKLKNKILFEGYKDYRSLLSYYRKSFVLVLPSLYEGLPKVVLESLACGTPVVASGFNTRSPIKGLYLLKELTPKLIADKIKAIRRSKVDVDTKFIENHYSWLSRANELAYYYDKVLQKKINK